MASTFIISWLPVRAFWYPLPCYGEVSWVATDSPAAIPSANLNVAKKWIVKPHVLEKIPLAQGGVPPSSGQFWHTKRTLPFPAALKCVLLKIANFFGWLVSSWFPFKPHPNSGPTQATVARATYTPCTTRRSFPRAWPTNFMSSRGTKPPQLHES